MHCPLRVTTACLSVVGIHSDNSLGVPALEHGFCVRMVSYKEVERVLLAPCVVVGDRITASIDLRSEWKTMAVLYLLVVHKFSLINLHYPFIQALADSHSAAYTHPHSHEHWPLAICILGHS